MIETFNPYSIQLGLWLVNALDLINDGTYDYILEKLTLFVRRSPCIFYLRIGYEFDSPQNNYDPVGYKLAFIRIASAFRRNNVSNIAFVWHSSGEEPRDSLVKNRNRIALMQLLTCYLSIKRLSDWFPGSDYVDWCGLSIFQQPYSCRSASSCSMKYLDSMATFCKNKQIPIMIAESTPFGGTSLFFPNTSPANLMLLLTILC